MNIATELVVLIDRPIGLGQSFSWIDVYWTQNYSL